jgi:hypothetical protein
MHSWKNMESNELASAIVMGPKNNDAIITDRSVKI